MEWFRKTFGTLGVVIVIGFIAIVFVFYGVFSPRSTRGIHEGAVAGKVNGESITISEFQRELNQRLEYFKNLSGNVKFTEDQLKAFRVREGTFESLVNRKLMIQEAVRQGLTPSDEEVRNRIQNYKDQKGQLLFQKDGKFDYLSYKRILEANQLTPTGFERDIRESLTAQAWDDFFKKRIHLSESEVRKHFELSANKRNIKFVLLTMDTGKKGVKVSLEEITKYLADAGKLNILKNQYERQKDTVFKGKTFDQVKNQLAQETLAGEKTEEVQKINSQLADQALGLLKADKASDAKINALLKPYGTEIKFTGLISQLNPTIPGVGNNRELEKDAFDLNSPIDVSRGGKPKKYVSGPWTIVAIVSESQKPDFAKFEKDRSKIEQQLAARKEREYFELFMKQVREKAKVEKNPDVINDG